MTTNLFNRNNSLSCYLKDDKSFRRYLGVLLWLYGSHHEENLRILLARILTLRKNNGSTWTVSYLKGCLLCIQHLLAGRYVRHLGETRIAQNPQGWPLIVPGPLRLKEDNSLIKIILGVFSIYRVMECERKLKLNTITDEFSGISTTLNVGKLGFLWARLFKQLVGSQPAGLHYLLNLKTSGPNFRPAILGATSDAFALSNNHSLMNSICNMDTYFHGSIYKMLTEEINVILTRKLVPTKPFILGKLSFKNEAAGKVRVFAICDIWTQSVLRPIHQHTFDILKQIPNDGCFDQGKPLKRLMSKGLKDLWSFDLSAATDRFPIDFQVQVLSLMYNQDIANDWKNLLVNRPYINTKIRSDNPYDKLVYYSVGQPMGAYSSWGVFSLCHHVVVQYAASLSGFTDWFDDYALLGDDIVIGNKEVADKYLTLMTEVLGVEINLSKSLISNIGVCEFAKQLVSPEENYSPLGPKNIVQTMGHISNLPSLIRDLISKGGVVTVDKVTQLFNTLPSDFRIGIGKRNRLLWLLIGPFGFVNTGLSAVGPLIKRAEQSLTPYDMRLRNLSYVLDSLIYPIKKILKEDYAQAWKRSVQKTSDVLFGYRKLHVPYGFTTDFKALTLYQPDIVSLLPNEYRDIFYLPSFRSLLLSGYENYLDLIKLEEPDWGWPYSLSFEEGLIHVLNKNQLPSPEDNALVKPIIKKPKIRNTNIKFFERVSKEYKKMLKENQMNDSNETTD